MDKPSVPALMFHSVGLEDHPWTWSYISESISSFERKIKLLKEKGFNGIFWGELWDYMAGLRSLPRNSILLTFDDGYLDNWVNVYPILKRYGMKGTIFVTPDFVDPSPEPRPNREDLKAGRCRIDDLQVPGFLSWAEMRVMEASGLVDIQSHAMTHTWYFSGPGITDYHAPRDIPSHPWMFWNARPDRKPYYLTEDQQEFLPWGYPILDHRKSLEVTRFHPDSEGVAQLTDYVGERGGRAFFERPTWRAELDRYAADSFGEDGLPGVYETEQERSKRIAWELRESKNRIETNLGKSVDFICWPGGANDEAVQGIARDLGYKSWTLSSRSQAEKRNRPGADPTSIKRIGTSNQMHIGERWCGTGGPRYLLWRILEHQGSVPHSLLIKCYKLAALGLNLGRRL